MSDDNTVDSTLNENLTSFSSMLEDYQKGKYEVAVSRGIKLDGGESACVLVLPLSMGQLVMQHLFGAPKTPAEAEKKIIVN